MMDSPLHGIAAVVAQATPAGSGTGAPAAASWQRMIAQFFPFVILFVVLYFLWIRPEQKRAREHREMIQKVKAGDRIVTSGGIYGTISEVREKSLLLRVGGNVDIEIDRAAIGRVERVA
ncbi:MAG: preprotein translocase subunit YajC [Lentisphaerae bacterium ADurb.BinA184]|nr:MAG: preprotein translocase subunit YajC [Lentisphaerae bacterium ADurb.BinA184]